MHDGRLQPCGLPIHHHVFVDFYIAHRRILIGDAAFEVAFAMAKQRQFGKCRAAMSQPAPKEVHLQFDPVTVDFWAADRSSDLLLELSSERFVCVQQQHPVELKRKIINRPLPLLGPTAVVMKLNHLSEPPTGNFASLVRTLGIDHDDLARPV